MTNARPIIEVRGLTKAYGSRIAVNDLTFSVPEGQIFGFLGPNGAGKSTTVRLLLGLLRPDRGEARVAGYDCWLQSKEVHRLSGVAFEISNLYERLTARENLAFFARLAGRSQKDVDWALEAVGLADRASRLAQELSRGMRQRLILARAMLHRPRLLFLDEPTAGLDPNAAREVRALIKAFQQEGCTIFLTTHDMAEAESLCQRVGIVSEGRLLAMDEVAALKARYGKPAVRLTLPGRPGAVYEYDLSEPAWLEQVRRWQADDTPFWVHTREATLAQVFHRLTDRARGTGQPEESAE